MFKSLRKAGKLSEDDDTEVKVILCGFKADQHARKKIVGKKCIRREGEAKG